MHVIVYTGLSWTATRSHGSATGEIYAKCTVHILCLYGDTVHLCGAHRYLSIACIYCRRPPAPAVSSKLTFLSFELTFLSCKLTFLSCKLTFLSCKLTFLVTAFSRGKPFETGCLPLSYSGNPGVNDESHRGCAHGQRLRQVADGAVGKGRLGRRALHRYVYPIARRPDAPCEIRGLPLSCHCNSGVNSRY